MSVDGRKIRIRVSNIDSGRQSPSTAPHVSWSSRTEPRADIQMSIFWSLRHAGIKVGPVFLLQLGSRFQIELLSGKGGRSMWTTLFTVVLVLAATLNVLAIVSEYIPPD
jgi:hypothetical protein